MDLEEDGDYEDEDDEFEDEDDPDPPDESIATASADYHGGMTYGGPIFIRLGRWGDELEIRHYVDEDLPPEGELMWSAPAGSHDAIRAGRAALFGQGLQMVTERGFFVFECDETTYVEWRTAEEIRGGAPWDRDDAGRLRERADAIAESMNLRRDEVSAVLSAPAPTDEPTRSVWWEAWLHARGCTWSYGTLSRLQDE